jgi:hypothetical protein
LSRPAQGGTWRELITLTITVGVLLPRKKLRPHASGRHPRTRNATPDGDKAEENAKRSRDTPHVHAAEMEIQRNIFGRLGRLPQTFWGADRRFVALSDEHKQQVKDAALPTPAEWNAMEDAYAADGLLVCRRTIMRRLKSITPRPKYTARGRGRPKKNRQDQ